MITMSVRIGSPAGGSVGTDPSLIVVAKVGGTRRSRKTHRAGRPWRPAAARAYTLSPGEKRGRRSRKGARL
jgi:hypothetical protein